MPFSYPFPPPRYLCRRSGGPSPGKFSARFELFYLSDDAFEHNSRSAVWKVDVPGLTGIELQDMCRQENSGGASAAAVLKVRDHFIGHLSWKLS